MAHLTSAAAIASGVAEAFTRDDRVIVLGNADFAGSAPGDSHAHFKQLTERFADRFIAAPTSEYAICGMAAGAAMAGLRPMVSVPTASFAFGAVPAIVNDAAIAHYMSNRRLQVPVVYFLNEGIRGVGGSQHSHSVHSVFSQFAGLRVLVPSSPQDFRDLIGYALLHSANPTVFLSHFKLLDVGAEVDLGPIPSAVPKAVCRRLGKDVTVVAMGVMVGRAEAAADRLSKDGIFVEIVDPRSLVPLDLDTILDSVQKTGRLVVADESNMNSGFAGEIVSRVCENIMRHLKGVPMRVAIPDVPVPFSRRLEEAVTPTSDGIVATVRALLR